jgi:hypothetical protein
LTYQEAERINLDHFKEEYERLKKEIGYTSGDISYKLDLHGNRLGDAVQVFIKWFFSMIEKFRRGNLESNVQGNSNLMVLIL